MPRNPGSSFPREEHLPRHPALGLSALAALAVLVAALWALVLTRDWGPDFGVYYVSASRLGDGYRLYREVFDHKGPLYYLFLQGLGSLVGWSPPAAYLSLAVTAALFLLSVVFIAARNTRDFGTRFVLTLGGCALLVGQPSNASIALFEAALLLLALHWLVRSWDTRDLACWHLAAFCWLLAILTRIDAVVFAPIFLAGLIRVSGRNLRALVGSGIGVVAVAAILLGACELMLGFTTQEFWVHNVRFNAYYRGEVLRQGGGDFLAALRRSGTLEHLGWSGAWIWIVAGVASVRRQGAKVSPSVLVPSLGILGLAIVVWFATRSARDYHLFILYVGSLSAGLVLLPRLELPPSLRLAVTLFLGFATVNAVRPAWPPLTGAGKKGDRFQLESDNDRAMVADLAGEGRGALIGNNAWIYLFARIAPPTATNNFWFYRADGFETAGLLADHDRLRSSSAGLHLWVRRDLACTEHLSAPLRELLARAQTRDACAEPGRYGLWVLGPEPTP